LGAGFECLEARRVLAAVSIADVTAEAGGTRAVPINIDTASGVRGAEIRLLYDTELLDLTNEAVTAGNVWTGAGDTLVVANVDDASGSVVIFISAASGLADVSGSLAILNFSISPTAGGRTAALDLVEVILNEGAIVVAPAPQPGPDPTDGSITIDAGTVPGRNRIGGLVFADADGNGVLGPGEAIPGVTIRLIHTGTQAQFETTTDDHGGYQFNNLAAGEYRIEQVQPVAFINLSPNTLTVQLSEGQSLDNQNFIERGLRAAHHYTRILTTLVEPIDSPAWRSLIRQITVDGNLGTVSAPQAPSVSTPGGASFRTTSFGTATFPNGEFGQGAAPSSEMSALQPEGEADARMVWSPPAPRLATFYAHRKPHDDPHERWLDD
jgi:hypothetical protein